MADTSLRDALSAAMSGEPEDQVQADPAPAAPAAEAAPQAAAEPALEAASDTPAEGAQPRAADGKFAPKTANPQPAEAAAEPAKITAEPAKAPAEEAPTEEPIRVPASLPAALKAKFKELPPEWRDAFSKREEDVNTAKAQWDAKAAQFNRLEEILAPRRERFALEGLDDVRAIQTLFAAQDLLDRSPLEGIAYLARSYGVDLRQLGQQPAGGHQQAQAAPQLDPALHPVLQKVQTLESTLASLTEASQRAELQRGLDEIESFKADPAHLYFDNVKDDIVVLLETGRASDLKDAYDKACWANPEIRGILINEQATANLRTAAAEKAKATEAERQRAAAAKAASGSVTGSPALGASPAGGSKGNLREDLLAAYGEHAA